MTFSKVVGKDVPIEKSKDSIEVVSGSKFSLNVYVPQTEKSPAFVVLDLNKNKKTGSSKFVRHFAIAPEEFENGKKEVEIMVPGFLTKYYVKLYVLRNGNFSKIGKGLRFYSKSHAILDIKEFFNSFQKSFKKYGKRLIFLQHLNKLVSRMGEDLSEIKTFPTISGKLPSWWWNPEEHDRLLLKAIYRYGYNLCQKKMKEVEELGFCGEKFNQYLENKRIEKMKQDEEDNGTTVEKKPIDLTSTLEMNSVVIIQDEVKSGSIEEHKERENIKQEEMIRVIEVKSDDEDKEKKKTKKKRKRKRTIWFK